MIGHSHAREVCQSIHVKVDKEKAQELGLPAGTSWVRLTNIRAGDKPEDPPVVCTQVFIPEVWEDVVAAAGRSGGVASVQAGSPGTEDPACLSR